MLQPFHPAFCTCFNCPQQRQGIPGIVLNLSRLFPLDDEDRLLSFLQPKTHRVIALDPRGHGKSDKPTAGYRLLRLAKDLLNLMDHYLGPRTLLLLHPKKNVTCNKQKYIPHLLSNRKVDLL
jgi:hypothetical protein